MQLFFFISELYNQIQWKDVFERDCWSFAGSEPS